MINNKVCSIFEKTGRIKFICELVGRGVKAVRWTKESVDAVMKRGGRFV